MEKLFNIGRLLKSEKNGKKDSSNLNKKNMNQH